MGRQAGRQAAVASQDGGVVSTVTRVGNGFFFSPRCLWIGAVVHLLSY